MAPHVLPPRSWLSRVALSAIVVMLGTAAPAAAPDPVEDLREALKVPTPGPAIPDVLAFREQNLLKCVNALHGISQLRRALRLWEWRDEDRDDNVARLDGRARSGVAERFQQAVREAFRRNDPAARAAAANVLAGMGVSDQRMSRRSTARALAPGLVRLVRRDPSPEVRVAAARALGKINPEIRTPGLGQPDDVIPALDHLLQHGGPAERRAAAGALGDLVQTLSGLLKWGMPAQGSRAELPHLAGAVVPVAGRGLRAQDVEVRRRSAEAVRQVAAALTDAVPEPRASSDFPPPGRNPTAQERQDIEQYAGQLAEERAQFDPVLGGLANEVPGLAGLIGDPDRKVCLAANEALEALATLHTRVRQRRDSLPVGVLVEGPRSKAVREAMKPDDRLLDALRGTVPSVATAAADRKRPVEVRLASLYVLETLDTEAAPAGKELVQALRDDDPFIRWGAARALGKLAARPPEGAALGLGERVLDENNDVRLTAFAALERYGPAAKDAVPALVRALGRDSPELRLVTIQTLAAIGREAKAAGPALVKVFSSKEPRVRAAAAQALSKLGAPDSDVAAALRKALNDPDADVREAASLAFLGED